MKSRKITYFKYLSLFCVMVVLVFIAGCTGASPTTPLINSFSASPPTITVGDSSVLSWIVTDATSVTIDNAIGSVALSGITAVNPTTTTAYTLTATNADGSVTATTTVAVSSYFLLDIGPAGGYIFYDKGSYSDGWRYLESAPSDQILKAVWGCDGIEITGADGQAVGTGEQNTIDIEFECTTAGTAADVCTNLSLAGYNNWFLPSKDELNLMYTNLKVAGIGSFAGCYYWSSSESYITAAYGQNFYNGDQNGSAGKYTPLQVRAIRAF